MATIESYSTKSGKRYRVRYRTPDHRQTDKRGFRTKRDAEAFAATVEVEKLTGSYVAPTLGRITVGELAPDWLSRKESDVAPSNYRTLDSAWRTHVEPKWGQRRISDIELGEVERWIADLGRTVTDAKGETVKRGAGATTIIRAYGVLAGVLDDAVKSRRLAGRPIGIGVVVFVRRWTTCSRRAGRHVRDAHGYGQASWPNGRQWPAEPYGDGHSWS